MEYCLTDLCELTMGQSPDSSSCNKNGDGIPFYQGNADFGEKNPTPRNWCLQPKKIAKKDDILISVRAPIGDLNIANEDCCIGRGVASIRMKSKECDRNYLYLFLESKSKYLKDCGTGSTFTAINKGVLESLKVECPELKAQITIANEIENIKTAIKYKNAELLCLNEAIQSEFVELFGENPVESGNWKVETLGDVCSSIVRGPFGSALKKDFFVPKSNDTVKVYEQKHAIQKSADIGTYYITNEKYEELKRFECKSGDFLMSCSGTMGEFYQLPEGCEKGIINQALCKFTLNDKLNSIMFLEWMKHSISNLETKGSGIKNVAAVSFVKQMPMFIPPKDIQNKFAAFVQQIDKSKFVLHKQLLFIKKYDIMTTWRKLCFYTTVAT